MQESLRDILYVRELGDFSHPFQLRRLMGFIEAQFALRISKSTAFLPWGHRRRLLDGKPLEKITRCYCLSSEAYDCTQSLLKAWNCGWTEAVTECLEDSFLSEKQLVAKHKHWHSLVCRASETLEAAGVSLGSFVKSLEIAKLSYPREVALAPINYPQWRRTSNGI